MSKKILAFAAGFFLSAATWAAPGFCPGHSGFASKPDELVKALLPSIERFYSSVPSLSPREEKWLSEELSQSDSGRLMRAVNSRDYALQTVKLNAGGLLGSLRVLSKEAKPRAGARTVDDWALFVYTLIEQDAAMYLARLESEGVISVSNIPPDWSVLRDKSFPLQNAISAARTSLARHILVCTLPQLAQ